MVLWVSWKQKFPKTNCSGVASTFTDKREVIWLVSSLYQKSIKYQLLKLVSYVLFIWYFYLFCYWLHFLIILQCKIQFRYTVCQAAHTKSSHGFFFKIIPYLILVAYLIFCSKIVFVWNSACCYRVNVLGKINHTFILSIFFRVQKRLWLCLLWTIFIFNLTETLVFNINQFLKT